MGRKTTKKQVLDLTVATKRADLSPRRAPYSSPLSSLGKGVALLLYVGVSGHMWKSRTPKMGDKVIGPAAMSETADIPPLPASEDSGQTFEQARVIVSERLAAENMTREDKVAAKTFGEIWDDYVKWSKIDGKTVGASALIRSFGLQIEPLFPLPAATTSLVVLKDWREGLIGTKGARGRVRTPASVGKVVATLKAACNYAETKGPWQDLKKPKVSGSANASAKEPMVFSAAEMSAYVDAASSVELTFGTLCQGLRLTGARPGELAQTTVSDVKANVNTGTTELLIRFGKTVKKTGERRVRLSASGQRFFRELAAGRSPDETLFLSHKGKQWDSNAHKYFVKRASAAIGKPKATLYAFRHGYISAAIYKSLPLTSIARNCGTSANMIQVTYAHALGDLEDKVFAQLDAALDVGPKLTVVK
jgi:integrase